MYLFAPVPHPVPVDIVVTIQGSGIGDTSHICVAALADLSVYLGTFAQLAIDVLTAVTVNGLGIGDPAHTCRFSAGNLML